MAWISEWRVLRRVSINLSTDLIFVSNDLKSLLLIISCSILSFQVFIASSSIFNFSKAIFFVNSASNFLSSSTIRSSKCFIRGLSDLQGVDIPKSGLIGKNQNFYGCSVFLRVRFSDQLTHEKEHI